MNVAFRKLAFRVYYVPGSELEALPIPSHDFHFAEEEMGAQEGPRPHSVPMPASACHHALLKQTIWGIHVPVTIRVTG